MLPNALNQRAVRGRKLFDMVCWRQQGEKRADRKSSGIETIPDWCYDPDINHTRGVTPGVVDLRLPRNHPGNFVKMPSFNSEWRSNNTMPSERRSAPSKPSNVNQLPVKRMQGSEDAYA